MSIGDTSNPQSLEILDLFPTQGEWQDGDYFALPGNRIVELVSGRVEVLSRPSLLHQFLARLVFLRLNEFVESANLGIVMSAPTKVRIGQRHYRVPDVLFVASENLSKRHEQYWERINLAVEIISPDDPDRDLIDKRADYALAGVEEYWLIDPRNDSITVLSLVGDAYSELPLAADIASSKLLYGFQIEIRELFRQARSQ